jgi:hypothetical protein
VTRPAKRTAYFDRLCATLPGLIRVLAAVGIEERYLVFGGEGAVSARKPTVPTDARSEFLANRAMGDWAECALGEAIRLACSEWNIVQYGSTERMAAGHPDFRQRYLRGVEETRLYGKRPDLLLLPSGDASPDDISDWEHERADAVAKRAIGAIEVRSSKFEALTYMRVRQEQKTAGKLSGRESPSFTVKVEDLKIVYRWLERYRVPQIYCQVFFDSVFAINFLDIFSIIADGEQYVIEKPEKSQEKATIMIPITCGRQIGKATALPGFTAEHKVTQLGRHDVYVVPRGGGFTVQADALRGVLLG